MILHGDVIKCIDQLIDESIHLIITSPPYNIGIQYANHYDDMPYTCYLDWLNDVWSAIIPKMAPGGRICINIGENKRHPSGIPTYAAIAHQLSTLGLLYRGTIIWNKNSAACHTAWGSWRSASNPHIVPRHEYILCYSKGSLKLDGTDSDIEAEMFMSCTRSVWSIGTAKEDGHPCPFPLDLARRLIQFYSFRCQMILDPFAGSGTVGVAAAQLGRRYVLIDNSKDYCELMKSRLRTHWAIDEIMEVR